MRCLCRREWRGSLLGNRHIRTSDKRQTKAYCGIDLSVSGDKIAKKSWKIMLFFYGDKKRKPEDRKESDHESITNFKK